MMRNNLFLNRLHILTDEGAIAYDETYHKGVNIIRGDNSSGKSTITHFIFLSLVELLTILFQKLGSVQLFLRKLK